MNDKSNTSLINNLLNAKTIDYDSIESLLNCKLVSANEPQNMLDLLLPDTKTSTSIFESSNSINYPEIEKISYKEFKNSHEIKEKTLTIYFKKGNPLSYESIKRELGDTYEFNTQPKNVPDNKRCSIRYKYNEKSIIFGFKSCENLSDFYYFILRQ